MDDFLSKFTDDVYDEFCKKIEQATNYFKQFDSSIDILEKNNEYLISIEMPGVEKEDIKTKLQNNVLIIEFVKNEETTTKTINLNSTIDSEKIVAEYKNGVLKITIAKKIIDSKEIKIL
ncbi:MAG: Hsp20/alpha crystallin family protein [Candidatus Nanoarchaeia archaeon]|nr:Hsp20/alpha crystallin family protein [Candidatus Nanoarchaeia archaeon]